MRRTLATGVSACGGSDPVDEVEDLPAGTTYVTLDSGFAKALDTLGLKPRTVGSANLAEGSLRFPITSGNSRSSSRARRTLRPGADQPQRHRAEPRGGRHHGGTLR